jgi:hypothetical protein
LLSFPYAQVWLVPYLRIFSFRCSPFNPLAFHDKSLGMRANDLLTKQSVLETFTAVRMLIYASLVGFYEYLMTATAEIPRA